MTVKTAHSQPAAIIRVLRSFRGDSYSSMIFSENRFPLFGIMLFCGSMIFSENRFPLFGIML
jgi:hypothetical protein